MACLLITHLPMKAEHKRNPELHRIPVILIQEQESKKIVMDSSPEAIGVIRGMPLQEALSRCNNAVLIKADENYYQNVFHRITKALLKNTPIVENADLGRIYVDLDGLTDMYNSIATLIDSLLEAVPAHMNPRIGIAQGKFPAYVAAVSSTGGQYTHIQEDVSGFMRNKSVDLLPIKWSKRNRMHKFGLHTLGQIALMPIGALQSQFGTDGEIAWEFSNGIDRNPILPYKQSQVVCEYLVFPSPTITLHTVMLAVDILLNRAFSHPYIKGRHVRKISLEANILHRPKWSKTFAFKDAISGKTQALSALKNMIDPVDLPGALEDMKMTLSELTGESGIQASMLSDIRKQNQLIENLHQLEVRLGTKPPIYRIEDVEPWSRIPERRQALIQFDP